MRELGPFARWHETEPVVLYLAPVAAVAIATVVAAAAVTRAVPPLLAAAVATLLLFAFVVAIARVRSLVWPERSAKRRAIRAARAAARAGHDAWAGTVSTSTSVYRLGPLR